MATNTAIKILLFLAPFAYYQSFAQQTNALSAKEAVEYGIVDKVLKQL